MNKTKTLSSLRITEKTYSSMSSALKKFNSSQVVSLSLNEFRRLSYEFLSQTILQDKPLDLLIKK